MDRRSFLKKSGMIIPALTIAGTVSIPSGKTFAGTSSVPSLSLSLITDQADYGANLIQELFDQMKLSNGIVNYTEYTLNGKHISDIAYVQSGQLIDFRKGDGPVAKKIRDISVKLELPKTCTNPVLMHFSYAQKNQRPKGVQIFKANSLIMEREFPEKSENIQLSGLKGKMILQIGEDRSARFTESSCKHKTCMTMGSINQAGQNLVCIPNQILVKINGEFISEVDGVTF